MRVGRARAVRLLLLLELLQFSSSYLSPPPPPPSPVPSSSTRLEDSLSPELHILLPRNGEGVRVEGDNGVHLLFQVLGVDMEEQGVLIQVEVDDRDFLFNTSHISGRVKMEPGWHGIRAQLIPARHAEAAWKMHPHSVAETRFLVHEPERLPGQLTKVEEGNRDLCLLIGTVRIGAREGSGTDGEVSIRFHSSEATETVTLQSTDRLLQDASRSCFSMGIRCSAWPLTHATVTHRTNNSWRGLFLEDIKTSLVYNCSLCEASGMLDAKSLRSCSLCDAFTLEHAATSSSCELEVMQGEEGGASANEEAMGEDVSSHRSSLFVCNRWFDEESGVSGVCPSLDVINGKSSAAMACAPSPHSGQRSKDVEHDQVCMSANVFQDQVKWVTNSRLGVSGMMGNQLFQLATLIAFAHRHQDMQVVIPDIPWTGREQERLRLFELLDLHIPLIPFGYLQVRVQSTFVEKQFHHDESVMKTVRRRSGNQEWVLMLRMREFQVRSKMKIRPELKRRAAAVLEQVRSDFGSQTLKGPVGDSIAPHLLMDSNYIQRATAEMERGDWCGSEPCVYLVFADTPADVQWCRENIPANIRTKFYSDYVPLMSTWEKGAGIAACDGHVVSTSTFSWWRKRRKCG
ncbi:hypothetical protein GUITHDRAFT_138926 [Guillardia theta CCMP2712]|uniref:Uncharacterized protein n=1 Tax=Guillardia theta (strain CCMP2712) TaxID=905079 RepID=L1JB60_GUITC|nr:hypothetical protein GUITHDRAFT_138926 [Guillardia theta CCMP2712]EKX45344.1 hypothetical protein GUITHDRAFT_138926 [Guillardia theta CCMP2712]|eukprot:XP_005832324.1 hypothetical protein GUITHDRAFT_138926 [Guillardia theta CCMP2712]